MKEKNICKNNNKMIFIIHITMMNMLAKNPIGLIFFILNLNISKENNKIKNKKIVQNHPQDLENKFLLLLFLLHRKIRET